MVFFSNRDMHTGVVGSMKTDEVLKEALDYSIVTGTGVWVYPDACPND
jgi:hypothetical protein